MRASACLLLCVLVAACAAPPPKPPARPPSGADRPASRIEVAPRPRWQPVPAKPDGAVVPGGRRHIVKRGETGIAIARAYGVPWSRIAAANNLDREATLFVGQALFVPTGEGARPTAPRPGQPPARPMTPEERAASFQLDIDDLITGSAPARPAPARPGTAPPVRPGQTATAAAVPPLAWPVDGRVILSRFGPKPGGRVNDGINIRTLRGATVRAAADGEVIYVGDAIAGFGLLMLVRHAGGTVTAYGHLEAALADRGDRVSRGQPIARAGSSGEATEPQLLFQVRQGRRALDPLLHLPR
ncbi:MAG: peptidoglycan DD-metalloendopeptidase family protein [Sphingomonadaceae bacterium]